MYGLAIIVAGLMALGQQGNLVKQTNLPPPKPTSQSMAIPAAVSPAPSTPQSPTPSAQAPKAAPSAASEANDAPTPPAQNQPAAQPAAAQVSATAGQPAPAAADKPRAKTGNKRVAAFWFVLPGV